MNTQWTDERIEREVFAIVPINVYDMCSLMQRMRGELTDATMTMKAAWIDAAGDYGTLLQKYDALLAYTRRLYAGAVEHGLSICLEAPEDVQAATERDEAVGERKMTLSEQEHFLGRILPSA